MIKLIDILNELSINKFNIIARQCPIPITIEVNTKDNPWLYLQSRNSTLNPPIGYESFYLEGDYYTVIFWLYDDRKMDDLKKFKESLKKKGIRFTESGAKGGKFTRKNLKIKISIPKNRFEIIGKTDLNELQINNPIVTAEKVNKYWVDNLWNNAYKGHDDNDMWGEYLDLKDIYVIKYNANLDNTFELIKKLSQSDLNKFYQEMRQLVQKYGKQEK